MDFASGNGSSMSILPQSENLRQSPISQASAELPAGVGLSLSHISPQNEKSSENKVVFTPPQLCYAVGASYCKVSRGGVCQGGGKRGAIVGRSAQSRRRLLDTLHSVQRSAYDGALFVTLTYPDEVEPTREKVKRDLDCMGERLRRLYPRVAVIWSQEPQQRKSGANVGKVYYHYHLILFGVGFIEKAWLSRTWYAVVGSENPAHLAAGTQVQKLRSAKQGIAYVAKYLSKQQLQELGLDKTGRTWGAIGRENLPVSFAFAVLTESEFYSLRRQLRHWVKTESKRRGRKVRYRGDERSGVTAYVSDETAIRLLMSM